MISHIYKVKVPGRKLMATAMVLVLILLALPGLLIAACVGDINLDGRVNLMDFAIMQEEMGRNDCSTTTCKSDLNSDGAVNSKDKEILQSEMGRRDCLAENMELTEKDSNVLRDVPSEADLQEEPPTELQEELQEEPESPPASDSELSEEVEEEKPELSRFIDNEDGTVTDPETGLMWTKNANLPCETMLFYQAFSFIEEMNRGNVPNFGYTDWRLPTLEELRSLKDFTHYTGVKKNSLPEGHPFKNVQWLNYETYYQWPTYFWTTRFAWFVSLYCRLVERNTATCVGFVWPVRGSKID